MNMQRLRKEAEKVIANDQFRTHYGGGTTDGVRLLEFASAFLALTDPTPLTVERLVERGYVHDAIRWPGYPDVTCLRRGKLYVYGAERENTEHWAWEHDDDGPSIWPVPRTVGELAMIELLMEGR